MGENVTDKKNSFKGLSDEEVKHYREIYGKNILTGTKGKHWIEIMKGLIKEPMIFLLIIVCTIYFLSDQLTEGIIMLVAIFIVAGISFYQEFRSGKALEALKKLNQPFSNVIRNGINISIRSEEIVVNDILMIEEGQIIPADAEVIESNDLSVDESIITGESLPVDKSKSRRDLYYGTLVTSGWGYCKVTDVGINTKTGKLGIIIEQITKEKSPLQIQLGKFVNLMAAGGIFAFVFVCVYNFILTGDFIQSLMHGLTLAMAVLPEEIPVAFSTFMALGAYHLIQNNIITKQPIVVESLGSATVICLDKTGTITENKMQVVKLFDFKSEKEIKIDAGISIPSSFHELIEYAMWASETIPFDPMEKAIHECFNNSGNPNDTSRYEMIHEYPLSHHVMTHIHSFGEKIVIACKGAPETIFEYAELNDSEIISLLRIINGMAEEGLRVIAVAKGKNLIDHFPEDQSRFCWEFLGLLGLEDPPKKNIKKVISDFYKCGIKVKMLTGDFPLTAKSISEQAGILNTEKVLTGKKVMEMTIEELKEYVSTINIFARVFPEAKLRIIEALKSNGEIVAMTGDGVNDGPALKASHIGIAMGQRGTETAKQSASLILVNDDLSNMVTAISYGRKIYSNLKKAFRYIISIHIPLISVVTLPLMLGLKFQNIFSPVHVIFLELVMGPTCSIAFENEPAEKYLMSEKPRMNTSVLFKFNELFLSVVQGLMITAGLLFILIYSGNRQYDESEARTLVFTTLVLSNIFLTLTGRSDNYTILKTIFYKNTLLYFIIGITLLLLVMSLKAEPVMKIFEFTLISASDFLMCVITAFVSVIWIEFVKLFRKNQL